MIHSSSATIGIVMGLGAAGVLDWQTAVAFSLGADLGTTITSWMASLNLSKNAKRAAYAHIAFNIIGVAVMLPLFFPSMQLLIWVMGWFGGDPGRAGHRRRQGDLPAGAGGGRPLFDRLQIFNTALLFPFVGVFERCCRASGTRRAEDVEDYSTPRYPRSAPGQASCATGVPAVQQETARYLEAAGQFLAIAREDAADAPDDVAGALRGDRRAQPRHPELHGGDVQARTCRTPRPTCWRA